MSTISIILQEINKERHLIRTLHCFTLSCIGITINAIIDVICDKTHTTIFSVFSCIVKVGLASVHVH